MVQPIDLNFCKVIEIIKQNFFIHADVFFVLTFFSWPDEYFQLMTSPILNPEIQNKMQNPRKFK